MENRIAKELAEHGTLLMIMISDYPSRTSIWSPNWVCVALIVFVGSSITLLALEICFEIRNGLSLSTKWMTVLFLSRKITSMENRIQNVWTLWHGMIHKPCPNARDPFPIKPMKLLTNVSAIDKVLASILFWVTFTAFMPHSQSGIATNNLQFSKIGERGLQS